MKINKTILNKILKASDRVTFDAFAYQFSSDEFELRLDKSQVDAVTSAVASKAVEGDLNIRNVQGSEVFIPGDLDKYLKFTSKDRARPLLCAINFTDSEIQATDSYRLLTGSNHSGIVGIYDAFALELASLIADGTRGYCDPDVNGAISFGGMLPKDGQIRIWRVPGEYPDVNKLIETGETSQLVIGDLPKKLNNRNSHINKDVHAVFFRDKILLSSFTSEISKQELIGEISHNSLIGVDDGEIQAVAFQYKYLKDAIDVLPSRGVYEMLYQGVRKPLQIHDSGYIVLLMPVMLRAKIVDPNGTEIVDCEQSYPRYLNEAISA